MQTLRNAHLLARFVLVWFALTVGAAIASPFVDPKALQLICSAGGVMKIQPTTDDGNPAAGVKMLDCPLCGSASAPPTAVQPVFAAYQPLAHVLQAVPASPIAPRTAAPLPARGPPAFS